MLTLRILCHGTLKEEYLRAACAEYKKRLGAYGRVEILEAKDDRTLASYIREKEYTFEITAAFCNECGGEMGVPGLMDYNIKEIEEQYRNSNMPQ